MTGTVRRPSSAGVGSRLNPLLGVCWAIGIGAGHLSCGGRAADGLEPEEVAPSQSEPIDDPRAMIIGPRRETCADNPLLAECPRADDVCRDNPLSAGCASAPEDVTPVEELRIAAAENVLATYCGACHGPALTENQASASINYINDWRQLIEVGLIEPCSPERSRIIRLMRAGDMPPAASGVPRVPDPDIDVVADTIDFGCNGE
jgi:hypothetical protein